MKDFHLKNGSSEGWNVAVTVLIVPNSFESWACFNEGISIG
jgi:hypothetical protein